MAVIACGALGGHIREIAARRGWPVELHTLPVAAAQPPGADRPGRRAAGPRAAGPRAAGGARLRGLRQLRRARRAVRAAGPAPAARAALLRRAGRPGPAAGDVRAGARHLPADRLPGAQLPPLGAGRARAWTPYPELWPDYFGHYRRLVWLAQSRDAALDAEAAAVAAMFGLPLTVIDVGTGGLERELARLLGRAPPSLPSRATAGRRRRDPRRAGAGGAAAAAAPVRGVPRGEHRGGGARMGADRA